MDRITRITAVRSLFQGLYHMADDNGTIKWKDEHETTDEENAQIDAEIVRLKEVDSYQHPRREAYPSIQDQLDYIYHNSITKWKSDMIKPVKDKYPKP